MSIKIKYTSNIQPKTLHNKEVKSITTQEIFSCKLNILIPIFDTDCIKGSCSITDSKETISEVVFDTYKEAEDYYNNITENNVADLYTNIILSQED